MDNELAGMLGMRERNARILDWDRLHISDLFLVCALAHVCVCVCSSVWSFPGRCHLVMRQLCLFDCGRSSKHLSLCQCHMLPCSDYCVNVRLG